MKLFLFVATAAVQSSAALKAPCLCLRVGRHSAGADAARFWSPLPAISSTNPSYKRCESSQWTRGLAQTNSSS